MIQENERQFQIPFEHLFMNKELLVKIKIEINNQITYQIFQTDEKKREITFSNGLNYQIYENENNVSYIRRGTLDCGRLLDKIYQLKAIQENEQTQLGFDFSPKRFLLIEIIDINKNSCFQKQIDDNFIQEQTNKIFNMEDAFEIIKVSIENIFEPNSMVQIQQGEQIYQLILIFECIIFQQQRRFQLQFQLEKRKLTEQETMQVRQQISQEYLKQQIKQIQDYQDQQENFKQSVYQSIDQMRQLLTEVRDSIINVQQRQEDQMIWNTNINQQISNFEQQFNGLQTKQASNEQPVLVRKQIRKQKKYHNKKFIQELQSVIVQLSQFKESNYEPQYITETFQNGVFQMKFMLADEETEFCLGILEEGNIENLLFKSKCYQIKFPQGLLKRGDQNFVNFANRPFFRRDQIIFQVDLNLKLFIVKINNQQLPPIKLSDTFSSFSFFCQSNYPLAEIISEIIEKN